MTLSNEPRRTALRLAEARSDRLPSDYFRRSSSEGTTLLLRAPSLSSPPRLDADVALDLRLARAAVALAPEDPFYHDWLTRAMFASRLYDQAIEESERTLNSANEEQKDLYRTRIDRLVDMIDEARARSLQAEDD